MIHPIYKITKCEHIMPYSLSLEFDDGSQRLVDLSEILEGEIFGPLKDTYLFAQVDIDPDVKTVVWPNGADFDPAILHDWPQHRDNFAAAAVRWKHEENTSEQGAAANP
jgi:hypothetical protein